MAWRYLSMFVSDPLVVSGARVGMCTVYVVLVVITPVVVLSLLSHFCSSTPIAKTVNPSSRTKQDKMEEKIVCESNFYSTRGQPQITTKTFRHGESNPGLCARRGASLLPATWPVRIRQSRESLSFSLSLVMSVDRGYLNLVSHLSRTSSTAPIEAIHGSIAHYLARVQPSATPLAALVISSPLLRTFSFASLDGLSTAFRHAVHLRIKVLEDEPTGIFSRGLATRMADWVGEVLKGLQGGYPVLRLACCSGLLQGLHDREKDLKMQNSTSRRRVEEEFVIALAEVLDLAPSKPDAWEAEFRSVARAENGSLHVL